MSLEAFRMAMLQGTTADAAMVVLVVVKALSILFRLGRVVEVVGQPRLILLIEIFLPNLNARWTSIRTVTSG